MIRKKITTWVDSSLSRAQRAFEKKSGWSAKQVETTLKKFRGLETSNQLILGGLIVGNAVLKGEASAPPASRTRSRKRRSSASRPSA